MRDMMKQMMGDRLPPGISPEDLPEPTSRGARLTAEYCGSCHALPSPQMHGASEWPAIVTRMQQNLQSMGRDPMTAEELRQITDYLQQHAQK